MKPGLAMGEGGDPGHRGALVGSGRTWLGYSLSLAVAGAMLVAVAWQADPDWMAERLRQVNGLWLSGVLCAYLATVWLRAARFRILLEPEARTLDWFRVTALHNFYFTFVPFKLGEASFLPLAGRRGVPVSEAGLALILSRFIELTVVLAIGLAGMALLGISSSIVPVIVVLALSVAVVVFYRPLAIVAIGAVERLARWRPMSRLERLDSSLAQGRRWLNRPDGRRHGVLFLSALICGMASLSLHLCFLAFDVSLSLAETLYLFAGLSLLGALGVFTVAGIGVSEMGLAGLLLLLGYDLAEATTLALLVRFFLLLAAFAGTALALPLQGAKRRA